MSSTSYFLRPQYPMRLFESFSTDGRVLRRTGELLAVGQIQVYTHLTIGSYDHVNKLALRLHGLNAYVLVEGIDPYDLEMRRELHELANHWPNTPEEAREPIRIRIARLLWRNGKWKHQHTVETALKRLEQW